MSKSKGRTTAKGLKSSRDSGSKGKRELDGARRSALKKLGLLGAFTAPAILSMTWSDKAAAVSTDSTSTD